MSYSIDLRTVLAAIDFSPSHSKEAVTHLTKFASLSEDEKDAQRGVTIEKVFPLAFGDNAILENAAGYQELREKPW